MKVVTTGSLGKRKLNFEVETINFTDMNRRGQTEAVLVYKNSIPGPVDEMDLYKDAKIEFRNGEVRLTYPDSNMLIILTNRQMDDDFRTFHQETIKEYETARIGDATKPHTLSLNKLYPGDRVYVVTPYSKPNTWIEGTVSDVKKPKGRVPRGLHGIRFLNEKEKTPFMYRCEETGNLLSIGNDDIVFVEISSRNSFCRKTGLFELKLKS